MKRHLSLAASDRHAHDQGEETETVVDRTRTAAVDGKLSGHVGARPRLQLAHGRTWRHTLILTGKLDLQSASELEEEIECLCQEGVATLTLDLRQLSAIDFTGARTIAFRSALCKRRGHDFAVISGPGLIGRTLVEAGATDTLTREPAGDRSHRFSSRSSGGSFSDVLTMMIKEL
ncbi:MAG TPA: STAS domain-containing protein [Solirubrobacteraceae bacterium]|jgi:anti-anti-sigma factor